MEDTSIGKYSRSGVLQENIDLIRAVAVEEYKISIIWRVQQADLSEITKIKNTLLTKSIIMRLCD